MSGLGSGDGEQWQDACSGALSAGPSGALVGMSFGEIVSIATRDHDSATGGEPYPYQQRLADEGLPGLLRVPTGAGKTLAAVLPWLFRRRASGDEGSAALPSGLRRDHRRRARS